MKQPIKLTDTLKYFLRIGKINMLLIFFILTLTVAVYGIIVGLRHKDYLAMMVAMFFLLIPIQIGIIILWGEEAGAEFARSVPLPPQYSTPKR